MSNVRGISPEYSGWSNVSSQAQLQRLWVVQEVSSEGSWVDGPVPRLLQPSVVQGASSGVSAQ